MRIAVLVVGALATALVAVGAHRAAVSAQDDDTRARLHDVAQREARQLELDLARWSELLATVNALDVDTLDVATFTEFVDLAIGDRGDDGALLGTYGGMRSFVWTDAGSGAGTATSYVIEYARPDATAEAVVGVDLSELPGRREGLELARDSGEPVVVGFFVPFSELDLPPAQQSQFGSLYVPIYRSERVPQTLAVRRTQIAGWAVTGFRATELLESMTGDDRLAFSLVADGEVVGSTVGNVDADLLAASAMVSAFDRTWTLRVAALEPLGTRSLLESPAARAVEVALLGVALLAAAELLFRWRASDRRRLEVVEERVQAMREARLQLADRMSVGVLDVDGEGTIRWANDAAGTVFDQEPDELAGRPLEQVLVEAGASPRRARLLAEQGWVEQGGEVALTSGRWIQLAPTAEPSGGHLLTLFDVTEAVATIDQLSESLDEAVRAQLQGQRLIATMSHEVRTPLAGIVGLTSLALEDLDPADDSYVTLRQVREVGSDLLAIVNDALAVTTSDNGTLRLSPSPVQLSQFLDELLSQHRPDAASGVGLTWSVEGVGTIVIDSSRLRQIVGNLVQNALRHTSDGAVTVRADRAADGLLRLRVRDTGAGIPADQQQRVFEPFWQVDGSTRRVGGAGMGLAVVESLVEAMGGRLALHSSPGRGSEFVIELPAPDAPASALLPVEGPDVHDRPAAGLRAVVVDDDAISREVARRQLERLGADVEMIADGPLALSHMASVDADIVLVDLHLPGVDGFAILREADATRARIGRPGLILAATASTGSDDHRRARAKGADAVLLKPVDRTALAELIRIVEWPDRTSGPSPAPVGDPDRIAELGELGVLDRVVELLTGQLPELGERMGGPVPEERRRAAHTLAGSLRTFGAWSLADEATELEELLLGVPNAATRLRVTRLVEAAQSLVARVGSPVGAQPVPESPDGAAR